ncbi:MAG TPA: ADP compounds hydrolase NudE, partial [Coxiellaceae bacterium]|nr:ADP compounds hydrolase NudE [Coxiellaceae bacterium]
VAKTKLFTVEDVHLRFANGQERNFERMQGRNLEAVMVVPLLDKDTFLLIREYGAGLESYSLAFPKGGMDGGNSEDMFACANRELKEEVGYGAHKLSLLASLSSSPSYSKAHMHIILAQDLYPERLAGDEPEPIEVVPWKVSQIDQLLKHPEFHETRSVAAVLLLERYLKTNS